MESPPNDPGIMGQVAQFLSGLLHIAIIGILFAMPLMIVVLLAYILFAH